MAALRRVPPSCRTIWRAIGKIAAECSRVKILGKSPPPSHRAPQPTKGSRAWFKRRVQFSQPEPYPPLEPCQISAITMFLPVPR